MKFIGEGIRLFRREDPNNLDALLSSNHQNVTDNPKEWGSIRKSLEEIFRSTRSLIAVSESMNAIAMYKNDDARYRITDIIKTIAVRTSDEGAVIASVKAIENYKEHEDIHGLLRDIAIRTSNRKIIEGIAKTLNQYSNNPYIGLGIASELRELLWIDSIANYRERLEKLLESGTRVMSGRQLADLVTNLSHNYKNEDPREANEAFSIIAKNITKIATFTDNETAVKIAIKTISQAKDYKSAVEISNKLSELAGFDYIRRLNDGHGYDDRSRSKGGAEVITASELIRRFGEVVFDYLSISDLFNFQKEFDGHSNDLKESDVDSLCAISTYLHSPAKLPRPSKKTIKDYRRILMAFVSEKYGIKKDLDMKELCTFFLLPESDREKLVESINNSIEREGKEYSIMDGDGTKILYAEEDNNPLHYNYYDYIQTGVRGQDPKILVDLMYKYQKDYFNNGHGFKLIRYSIEDRMIGIAVVYVDSGFYVKSFKSSEKQPPKEILDAVIQDLRGRAKGDEVILDDNQLAKYCPR